MKSIPKSLFDSCGKTWLNILGFVFLILSMSVLSAGETPFKDSNKIKPATDSTSNTTSSVVTVAFGVNGVNLLPVAPGNGKVIKVKATGYFCPSSGKYRSRAQARLEGGANDRSGNPLRSLQEYNSADPDDYVSCATDPRVIKTGTFFTIDEFPGVRFYACDIGKDIKGKHIDIFCNTEAQTHTLPEEVTVRTIE
ncbi:MAG: hypothetical protein HQM08_23760 [Candidatus Riflebacteria bacterium]|nr:hypothetical protein [Candidatus Riflebacteria bacterium]